MALTAPQQATLKAYVEADHVLSLKTPSAQSASEIKVALAVEVTPAWYVYRTNMPKQEVQNAVLYANMTPAQAIPANNTNEALQIWIAKNLLAQGKQLNLQNLLLGNDNINFALPNIRAGFQDALTFLPTKNDGTTQQAGWPALQLLISRSANTLEKLLATGTGSQASPATMGYEGTVNENDIGTAMGWSF